MKRLLLATALVLVAVSVSEAGYPYGYSQPYSSHYHSSFQPYYQPYYGPQPFSYRETWGTWGNGGYRSVQGIAPTPIGPQPYHWNWYWW
jgi:hypothetical protein